MKSLEFFLCLIIYVFSKLVCQVEYDRKHSFETIFSYRVPKPLDLKTKFYNTAVSSYKINYV